jgi:ABC-type enterochelin transport system permease subunit
MDDLEGSAIWRPFLEHWQSAEAFRQHCQLLMLFLSSVSSMGIKNFQHMSLLQISEFFYYNFMVTHKDVSSFVLLLREPTKVFNASGQSFFKQTLRATDFSTSTNSFFPTFTDTNKSLLPICIQDTAEDVANVELFDVVTFP